MQSWNSDKIPHWCQIQNISSNRARFQAATCRRRYRRTWARRELVLPEGVPDRKEAFVAWSDQKNCFLDVGTASLPKVALPFSSSQEWEGGQSFLAKWFPSYQLIRAALFGINVCTPESILGTPILICIFQNLGLVQKVRREVWVVNKAFFHLTPG